MYFIVALVILVWSYQTEAQNTQENALKPPGMVLEPLKYVSNQNEPVEVNATLCVINTSNEGPQWFLLSSDVLGMNERLGFFSAALMLITEIKASADGKYLAVLSVGEGHPMLEVIDLSKLFQKKSYTVLHTIDPYPGFVNIRSWEGTQLQIDSDVLLTRRDKKTGRVPPELTLSASEIFVLNVLTGEISGVSEGAKNPSEHYSRVLMDQKASETEKDAALSILLTLNPDEKTISYLLNVLEQEKDPKRILKLLDEISKLRGK